MRVKHLAALGAASLLCAAAPAAAQAEDVVVSSFDGTPIVTHVFANPALAPGQVAPTVLVGPGWSAPGDVDTTGSTLKPLLDAGYNVVTWDPRGFGASGGTVMIDTPSVEGRDVAAIVSMVAGQRWAKLDAAGDPRVGMAGGSYGGGIQYSAASVDRRIDALVPVVGWHSLRTSLYKDSTFKQGWDSLLYVAGLAAARDGGLAGGPAGIQTGGLDPHIVSAYQSGIKTGKLSRSDERWFTDRGPGDEALAKVNAPTLVVGGTVDTLFGLDEDVKIYKALRRAGTPVRMMWFCGGHGVCLTGDGDADSTGPATLALRSQRVEDRTLAWFGRYLRRDSSIHTGPGFEWLADDARWRGAHAWPPLAGRPVKARGHGQLRITRGYASGETTKATPARASEALQVAVRADRRVQIVGAPKVSLTYRGRATRRDARVFAQLVDVRRGIVVGNQVTPIPVRLDGRRHQVTRRLTPIAASARKGTRYRLQIVSSSRVWLPQRAKGHLRVSRLALRLPTAR